MSNSPSLRRFARAARILIPLLIVCLLPLLLLEVNGPTLKVGVVNADTGAEVTLPSGERQFIPFGRQLSAALLDTHEHSGAEIELLSIDSATQRFDEGTLDALVLIPAEFSTNLATFGTPRARQAQVELRIRESLAQHTHALARYIDESARASLGRSLNEGLLEGIYGGLDRMKDGMEQARDGAVELAVGTTQAARGIEQLHSGSAELSDGLERFSAGIAELDGGAGQLNAGSTELARGLGQLAQGAQELASGMNELAVGLTGSSSQPGLMSGVNALTDGVIGTEDSPGLVQGTRQLADGNRQLADGIEQMSALVDPLRKILPPPGALGNTSVDLVKALEHARALAQAALDALNAGAGIVDSPEAIALIKERMQALIEACPADQPEFCAQVKELFDLLGPQLDTLPQVHQQSRRALEDFLAQTGTPEFLDSIRHAQDFLDANGGIDGLIHGPQGLFAQVDALRDGTRQLADGAERLAQGVAGTSKRPGLAQGVTQLRDGVEELTIGVSGRDRFGRLVSDSHLSGGAAQLADGLLRAHDGARIFDEGVGQYRAGLAQAHAGARELSDGGQQLRSGSGRAADGLRRLDDGAGQLAQGLAEGAEAIPRYSPAQRAQILQVTLSPIQSEGQGSADNTGRWSEEAVHGAQIATLVIIMWVVGAVTLLRTSPFSQTQLSRPITAAQVTIHSLRGPMLIGAALSVVSLLVLWGIGPSHADSQGMSWLWTALASTITVALGVAAILAIHQGMLALSGPRNGPGVVMVALSVQLIPLVTSPVFHGGAAGGHWVAFSPLGALVRSFHAAYFHEGVSTWLGALILVLLWACAAVIVSIVNVARYRTENDDAALLEALRHRAQ